MLTVFIEHLKDAEGNAYTELVCSSNRLDSHIHWKLDGATYELVAKILKGVHGSKRIFDAQKKTWTFLGGCGVLVEEALRGLKKQLEQSRSLPSFQIDIISDLLERLEANALGYTRWKKKAAPFTPEDFFYNPPAKKERAWKSEFASLLGVTELALASLDDATLKKLYRAKALAFHPDRNNGDGTRMSALNELWQLWNKQ